MKRFYAIICTLLCFCAAARAQSGTSVQDKKAKLEKEIEILDEQLRQNAKSSSNALGRLTILNGKVSSRKALISQCDRKIAEMDRQIVSKQREINRAQERLDTMTVYYARLVKNAYKNRDPKIWYMYLLSGSNLGQIVHRYSYLKGLSGTMNAQAEKIKETKAELESQMKEIKGLREKARIERDSRAQELSKLKKDQTSVKGLISQLNKNKTKYQKELDRKRRQVEDLNKEVNKIISSSRTKVDTKLSGEFKANKGKLPWPAEGAVVDHFGQHYHPVYKKVKLPFNNGVTIAVKAGTKIQCVFTGVVKQVIVMPGYNQCVLVQHGSYFTFYCKLKSVSVKAGQKVSTGQAIGTVDTINGESQLHFQLWEEKTPKDPESWLK